MIIELAGIDGSGKSTLVAHLQGFFSARSVPCVERVLRSTYKRILADVARDAGYDHWRHLFGVGEVELAHALEMSTLAATTIAPLDHSYQIVVTDTYVSRWLATAHMWGAPNMAALARVYRRMLQPDLSFQLAVDPDLAYQRLVERPKRDHLVKLGNPDRVRAYAESFAAVHDLVPYPRHVLETGRDLDATVDEMLAIVAGWDSANAGLLGARPASAVVA
jgi:thymidylate kinase